MSRTYAHACEAPRDASRPKLTSCRKRLYACTVFCGILRWKNMESAGAEVIVEAHMHIRDTMYVE